MIVTKRIALRIALIVLLAVILQVSFFSYLHFFGAIPNLVPVVIVSLGLLGGGVVGAVCGFVAGLLVDSVLLQTLGVSSLVLLSIGYLAGRYREGVEITNAWIPPLLAGGFTLLAAAGFAAVELMLGVDASVSILFLREVVVQALLAVLLAIPVYPLIRRILAPALIDYEPAGRVLMPGLRRRSRRRGRGHARISRNRRAVQGGAV
jgi:rod shape-determining protein MreD